MALTHETGTGKGKDRRPLSGRPTPWLPAALIAALAPGVALAQDAPAGTPEYRVYVANESSDIVSRVLFVPGRGASVEKEIAVGIMPADNDGAHGLTVSPDGRFWYLTLAHGTPWGTVWKFAAGEDTLVGRTEAGLFPATMGITPDGQFLLAVNFNLHGDMVPSDVSVVHTPTMSELARVVTCLMPHGSRVSAAGTKQYSACMHSDQLVELDLSTFEVSGRFSVAPGKERALDLRDRGDGHLVSVNDGRARSPDAPPGSPAGRGPPGAGSHAGHDAPPAVCSPTWAEPGLGPRADRFVYVACNKLDEILEVDVTAWTVTRRFPTGKAPYNLESTPDGRRLVATLKGGQSIAVFDLEAGREMARIPTTRPITHGVVVSPDGRWAFVTNEAVGSTPGTLDVFDLERLEMAASVDLRHQPGGLDFWGGPSN